MEKLFEFRQETEFEPLTYEPAEGWLGKMQDYYGLTQGVISLGKNLESVGNTPPPLTPKTWTDRKQKQRENLKKFAAGHKIHSEQEQNFEMTMNGNYYMKTIHDQLRELLNVIQELDNKGI